MKFKLMVTLCVIFCSIAAQASVEPVPVKMKFVVPKTGYVKPVKKNATDFDLNWTVPPNYLQWHFRLILWGTGIEYHFDSDGVNDIGVLGYIPPGHYLVEFSSNYYRGPFMWFGYTACWGGKYLGNSSTVAAYWVDFDEWCNELGVSLE